MLKNNEPYRYAQPALLAEKFTTLKRAPSGRTTKVRKPTASVRSLAQEGLAAVYAQAGLPQATSPEDLPAGEPRMIKDRKLKEFVAELYSPVDPARQPPRERTRIPKANVGKAGRPTGRPR